MYRHVPRGQIADALSHLRELFREIKPANEQEHRAHERREVVTKNLLSNLFRTKEHPTLNAVLEIGDIFSLTLDGAHRLFGYSLEEIREFDRKLNGGRTHIIESSPRLVMGAPHMFWPVRYPCAVLARCDWAFKISLVQLAPLTDRLKYDASDR